MTNEIHYFIDANSSKEYVDYYNSNFQGVDVMKFKNYPKVLIDEIFEKIVQMANNDNIKLEFIHNCIDNSIGGIVNTKNNKAIINIMPYCTNQYLYNSNNNSQELSIIRLNMQKAYKHFKKALDAHDEWEQIYISNINFAKINMITSEFIDNILPKKNKILQGRNKNRFFGAATINGSVDYITNITSNIKKRYFIKGRPGTGKSTFLKKIRDKANQMGYNTCTYHCSFDPNSLDMLVIPELSIAIFDSTAPHEHFPDRKNDSVIDIYKQAVKAGTDEKYSKELEKVSNRYRLEIGKATEYLKEAYKNINSAQKEKINHISKNEVEKNMIKSLNYMFPDK